VKRTLPALLLLSFSLVAIAAGVEPRAFDRPEQEARYRALIAELRCLVCQNQNLAESDAELARDLRDQTYEMIRAGRSDDEIVEFMVGRYGDFVLYRPPVTVTTALLWFGPAVLVTLGAVLALLYVRRRAGRTTGATLSEDEEKKARALLSGKAVDP